MRKENAGIKGSQAAQDAVPQDASSFHGTAFLRCRTAHHETHGRGRVRDGVAGLRSRLRKEPRTVPRTVFRGGVDGLSQDTAQHGTGCPSQ